MTPHPTVKGWTAGRQKRDPVPTSLRGRLLALVRQEPRCTAWTYAKLLDVRSGTVAATLVQLVAEGRLRRTLPPSEPGRRPRGYEYELP